LKIYQSIEDTQNIFNGLLASSFDWNGGRKLLKISKQTKNRNNPNEKRITVPGNVVNEVQSNCRLQKNGNILCKKCSKKWEKDEFENHHCEPNKVHCKICNKYIKIFSYQQHKARHENLRLHKCEICNAGFNQSGHLLTHMDQVHNQRRKYVCEICGKASKTPWMYRSHLKTKHEKKSFPCPHCNYLFSSKGNLETHVLAVHDEMRYPCWICFKKFAHSEILEKDLIPKLCNETPLCVIVNDSHFNSKKKKYENDCEIINDTSLCENSKKSSIMIKSSVENVNNCTTLSKKRKNEDTLSKHNYRKKIKEEKENEEESFYDEKNSIPLCVEIETKSVTKNEMNKNINEESTKKAVYEKITLLTMKSTKKSTKKTTKKTTKKSTAESTTESTTESTSILPILHARYIFINEYQLNNHKLLFHPSSEEIESIFEFKEKYGRWPNGNVAGICNDEKKIGRILYKILVNKTFENFEKCTMSVAAVIEDCKQNMSKILEKLNDEEINYILRNFENDGTDIINE